MDVRVHGVLVVRPLLAADAVERVGGRNLLATHAEEPGRRSLVAVVVLLAAHAHETHAGPLEAFRRTAAETGAALEHRAPEHQGPLVQVDRGGSIVSTTSSATTALVAVFFAPHAHEPHAGPPVHRRVGQHGRRQSGQRHEAHVDFVWHLSGSAEISKQNRSYNDNYFYLFVFYNNSVIGNPFELPGHIHKLLKKEFVGQTNFFIENGEKGNLSLVQ